MYALDFEYDGQYLSDYGFIICDFNGSSGANIVSAGSKITFNTVQQNKGKRYSLTGTQYDEVITCTFDICKNPDLYTYDKREITNDEYRDIMRWLNRREFCSFQILDEDPERESCHYNASFNVDKITINDKLYGLELSMQTDKPFGYAQEQRVSWACRDLTKTYMMSDVSDEIGNTFPTMKITILESGNLSITNQTLGVTMIINNCEEDEVITINGESQYISSSLDSHKVYNDFNFRFFQIGNTIDNRLNKVKVTLPCLIELTYSPIIKDAP